MNSETTRTDDGEDSEQHKIQSYLETMLEIAKSQIGGSDNWNQPTTPRIDREATVHCSCHYAFSLGGVNVIYVYTDPNCSTDSVTRQGKTITVISADPSRIVKISNFHFESKNALEAVKKIETDNYGILYSGFIKNLETSPAVQITILSAIFASKRKSRPRAGKRHR